LRIISGKSRGTKLFSPEGEDTRPTLDRVREAIFSMIAEIIPASKVLDLFAGSGAMGLEALSRGADMADFVDISSAACSVIAKNIDKTHLDGGRIHNCSFEVFLKRCSDKYDLIFLDPPYSAGYYRTALDAVKEYKLLADGGMIVAECSSETELDCMGFEIFRMRKYGKVNVYILTEGEI